jgi:DNA repair protein RadC
MQTDTTTLRELTVRYSVRKDSEDRPVVVGRELSRPCAAASAFMALLQDEPAEVFAILCLTTKHRVIAYHEVSRGTLDSTVVHPREVFKAALLANAAAIIAAHYVPRHIMSVMCRRSLCGRGQWKPPITPVDTLIAGT